MIDFIKFKKKDIVSTLKLIPHEFFYFIQFAPTTFYDFLFMEWDNFENMIMRHAFPKEHKINDVRRHKDEGCLFSGASNPCPE